MKKHSLFLPLLTATLFAIPSLARAETPVPPTPESSRADLLQRYDANHDGRLDDGERAAARADWREHHRHGPRAKLREKILQRFDHDHDGQLNDAERAEVRQARHARQVRRHQRREEILQRFDRNGDGKLDEGERQEARQAWEQFLQQHPVVTPAAKPAGT